MTNNKDSYDFNEAVTMSCKYGLTGKTVTARCTDVNKWSDNTPVCKSKICRSVLILILTRHSYKLLQNTK
jgi:hypothetical protein